VNKFRGWTLGHESIIKRRTLQQASQKDFMRVFALSDIHVDYEQNLDWLAELSASEYQDDLLLLAGDVSDDLALLEEVLGSLASKFRKLFFVPGNHELWVRRRRPDSSEPGQADNEIACSVEKFKLIRQRCEALGVACDAWHLDQLSIVPLLGWYDFSFGEPDRHLRRAWRDFRACSWPRELDSAAAITDYFLQHNEASLEVSNQTVISFSHFLPRLDVMPAQIPTHRRRVYPVLGSAALGEQVARLQPDLHVYGHSHVNQAITLGGTRFINNAFAYPDETSISRKRLLCVWDSEGGIQC
jgi:predicted phosphodiesterase